MENTQLIRAHVDNLEREVSDKIETVTAQLDDNPVGVIRRRFEELKGINEPYLIEAKEMAELVVPGMYEGTPDEPYSGGTSIFGLESFVSTNQSLIAQGVLLLSWTMASVILPSDGDYFTRSIEASVAAQFEKMEQMRQAQSQAMGQAGDPPDFTPIPIQMNNEFLRDDLIIKKQTAASNHQETLATCIMHSLVSGISVFGHLSLTEAKPYTIQNSVTVFDSAREPVEVIVVDNIPISKLPESVKRTVFGTGVDSADVPNLMPDDSFVIMHTQQIRVSPDTVRISTEIEGIPIKELSFDLPAESPALIPMPFMFPNEVIRHPIGWMTFNRGDLFAYENGERSVEGMVGAAAAAIMGLPIGANITTEEIRRQPGLSIVSLLEKGSGMEAIVAPIANNLQQVMARQEKRERRIMMIFGMDFAIQRQGERVTAEEIQRMAGGLQKLFGSTYKGLERGFQFKHVNRQFFLGQESKLVRPVDKKLYTLSLTTGLQTQEAQNEVAKMDQLLARDAQMAQLEAQGMGSFGREATMQWYAQKMKLDVSDKLLTADQKAEQLGVSQLLTVVRQMGPQAPGMLAQLLMQMTQGGGDGQIPGSA